jgi:hypothetical protein
VHDAIEQSGLYRLGRNAVRETAIRSGFSNQKPRSHTLGSGVGDFFLLVSGHSRYELVLVDAGICLDDLHDGNQCGTLLDSGSRHANTTLADGHSKSVFVEIDDLASAWAAGAGYAFATKSREAS